MSPETSSTNKSNSWLENAERVAKIVSLVAIPIVIPLSVAIYTTKIQETAQRESINRDYVQLAVNILKEKPTDISPGLRNWAVDLLAERSPTKFSGQVVAELKSGAVTLPGSEAANSIRSQASAVSADGKTLAYAARGSLILKDAATGKVRRTATKLVVPVSVDISPDGKNVAIADQSGIITLWSIQNMVEVTSFRAEQPLSTIRFLGPHRIEAVSTSLAIYVFDSNGQTMDFFPMHPFPPGPLKVQAQ